MPNSEIKQNWLLLVHLLPANPTNLRVRVWRKLQKLGAVAIKNSVYVLPFNDKTDEDFQWLRQEIESTGGEATVFRADGVEGTADDEIVKAFRDARDQEYSLILAELEALGAAIRELKPGGRKSVGGATSHEAELDRLHTELERITSTDFFDASGRPVALAGYEHCKALLESQNARRKVGTNAPSNLRPLNLALFQGQCWITRKNLFIDRLASIWLIKRFIDKQPRFSFVSDGDSLDDGIAFDMYEAEFTHQGEDCTFETMIKRFGLVGDNALRAIAEIVHDIDLKDKKFKRSEAAGLSTIIRGLAELLKDDHRLAGQCEPIFDGLYELLGKDESKTKEKRGARRTRGGGERQRSPRRK